MRRRRRSSLRGRRFRSRRFLWRLRRGDRYPGTVAQAVRSLGNDGVADIEAAGDDGVLAVAWPQRHLMHRNRIVFVDEVDVIARCAGQHSRRRRQHDLMQRVHEQLNIDELVRRQRLVVVGKYGAQRDRAGAHGHLIVDGVQRPGCKLPAVVTCISGHWQFHARRAEALADLGEIVLGDRELDCRRLDRRDDGNSGAR